jgi:outer membrane lipase/esterase
MNLNRTARLLLVLAAVAAAPLSASAYSNVVIFGDSLSDSGNNALVIGTNPDQVVTGNSYVPTFPYASGTYSNGPVWATSFAASLGLSAIPSLAGGSNYAFGGAQTRGDDAFPLSLRSQVSSYLGTEPSGAGDTLYVIAGGGNNGRAALEAISEGARPLLTISLTARRYANDVGIMVDQLQAIGAQNIVVWNTPDLGLVPAVTAQGSEAAAVGSAVAGAMNSALAERLAGEQGVTTFDLFGLLNNAVANPGSFGFSNVTDACGAVLGCDPSSYLFWDGIHPTSGGHALLAEAMFAAVVPEPGSVWLIVAGLAGLAVWQRRRA